MPKILEELDPSNKSYLVCYNQWSHYIHSDWTDLLHHYLFIDEDDIIKFRPQDNQSNSMMLFSNILFYRNLMVTYVDFIFKDEEVKRILKDEINYNSNYIGKIVRQDRE